MEEFNAASMRDLASQSKYYRTKIRIAASKGKRYKIFLGGQNRLGWLRNDLEPLGFKVTACAYGHDGDVHHIKVSWE